MGNKITKAVRSDKAEFRTGKTRPQPVHMSDIRGLRQQVWEEPRRDNSVGKPQRTSADS